MHPTPEGLFCELGEKGRGTAGWGQEMPEPVCVLGGIIGYGGRLARGIKTVATYETLEDLYQFT